MIFSLNTLFGWIATYRYAVLLPIAIIEGPMVSVIAGFLVSVQQMNFWIAFGILVAGDVIGDITLYSIGRWGRNSILPRFGGLLGVTPERMRKLESFFENHAKKTLLFGKWGHVFGFPILVTAGAAKEDFREFVTVSVGGTLPKTLFLVLIGFYFGASLGLINKYFTYAVIAMLALIVVAAAVYFFTLKIAKQYFSDL
jgi:membrane protein DedA with SNARE-associated domain